MIDSRPRVYCEYKPCTHSLDIELVEGKDVCELRLNIVKVGWFVDVDDDAYEILWGKDDVAEIIEHSFHYPFENDKHYCSLECAGRDA